MHTPNRIHLTGPGDLLAAIPHLLGFHPTQSIVVIGLDTDPLRCRVVLRTDLPHTPDDHHPLAHGLAQRLVGTGTGTVLLAVITPDQDEAAHTPVVDQVSTTLTEHGIDVLHRFRTAATTADTPWACYDDCACTGTLPDPSSSALAATTAADGCVTHPSREAITDTLAPDVDDHTLRERRGHLDNHRAGRTSREQLRLVTQAFENAKQGRLPEDDDDLVALAAALTDHHVRDTMLARTVRDGHPAAQQLWTVLVRATPAPYRAEPAVCLAASSYCRGEGAWANAAVSNALAADPRHTLAQLLDRVVNTALHPDTVRQLLTRCDTEPTPGGTTFEETAPEHPHT